MFGPAASALDPFAVLALALIADALIGDPPWLWRRVGHPVAWIGRGIGFADRRLNRPGWPVAGRAACGIGLVALLAWGAIEIGGGLAAAAALMPLGGLLEIAVLAILLAGRGLAQAVGEVAHALNQTGSDAARGAVRRIVGRDPEALDRSGIGRAALESLAENFSDGVVAPALWYLAFGLPGLIAYKAVNTADSMIGHRDSRHAAFGWAAARLDDVMNWPAARLSAALIVGAAGSPRAWRRAWLCAWRDGPRHRSVNAGWPEAAMAGALGVRLAGPRRYGGRTVDDAWMGDGRAEVEAADIAAGLGLYRRANLILLALVVAGWLLV